MSDDYEGWVTLREHLTEMQRLRDALMEERDRRYTEVNIEREKALRIKETADVAALGLAREIQTYKDEKANQLREQINGERGLYATKADLFASTDKVEAMIKPLSDFVASQQGRSGGVGMSWQVATSLIMMAIALLAVSIKVGI